MIKLNKYYIFTCKEDWDKDYNEEYNTFRGYAYNKKPIEFPCAYYYEASDYGTNGEIKTMCLEEAIEDMKTICEEEVDWYLGCMSRLEEIQYGKN